MNEATRNTIALALERLVDFNGDWRTIEQVARDAGLDGRGAPVFVLGWQDDLRLVADELVRLGKLERSGSSIIRYRRAMGVP